jgi:hypothetical protein
MGSVQSESGQRAIPLVIFVLHFFKGLRIKRVADISTTWSQVSHHALILNFCEPLDLVHHQLGSSPRFDAIALHPSDVGKGTV